MPHKMQSETQSKKNLWTDGPAISHKKRRFPVCQILFLPCFRLTFVTSLFYMVTPTKSAFFCVAACGFGLWPTPKIPAVREKRVRAKERLHAF